jgi:FAD-linked oxidoreductase
MQRRDFLKTLVATSLTSALPGAFLLPDKTLASLPSGQASPKRYPWKNWSGNQQCFPSMRYAPKSSTELSELIRQSSGTIRAVGSGHSFSELVPTDETLISIRNLNGLDSVDHQNKTATFLAGTTLGETGPLLREHEQALFNMPDVDHQTLAGAIATATHGTGRSLHALSAYVDGLTLVTAQGEEIECSQNQNSALFAAAQVNLGALGIVTKVRMKNRSAYRLKREAMWLPLEEVLSNADTISKNNRHFEFFYFPFTGMCLVDTLNITEEAINAGEELDGNSGIMDLKTARDLLSWSPKLRELIVGGYLKYQPDFSRVDHSYAIYANDRNVRFNEMEYHLPVDHGLKALRAVIQMIETRFPEVFFPIECRYIKGDDSWLSPFYQRDCLSIAVHRYFEEDFAPMFKAIEPVFQQYEGRPHWGKWNSFSSEQSANVYPKWQDFLALRKEYDPEGKFLNPYLHRLFGISKA